MLNELIITPNLHLHHCISKLLLNTERLNSCLATLRRCNRTCMALLKYDLYGHTQPPALYIPVCWTGSKSISLLFLACRDRFPVNNISTESQSCMLLHLPRDCQLYMIVLWIGWEIHKHMLFKQYCDFFLTNNTTASRESYDMFLSHANVSFSSKMTK